MIGQVTNKIIDIITVVTKIINHLPRGGPSISIQCLSEQISICDNSFPRASLPSETPPIALFSSPLPFGATPSPMASWMRQWPWSVILRLDRIPLMRVAGAFGGLLDNVTHKYLHLYAFNTYITLVSGLGDKEAEVCRERFKFQLRKRCWQD